MGGEICPKKEFTTPQSLPERKKVVLGNGRGEGGQKSIFIAIEKIMPVITKINWTSRRWNCYSLNNIWNSDVCIWFFSKVIYEIFHRRSSIWCLRKIFQETNISYPLLRTRNDWNISFSENFCVHTKCMIPHL